MNNGERVAQGSESFDERALAEQAKEHQERLRQDRERAAEKGPETSVESARHEIERADSLEREKVLNQHEQATTERQPTPSSQSQRNISFNRTMSEVRAHMSGPERIFSSIIHNPTVEKVSDVVGNTVARPNAILAGSVFAFLFTLAVYLIARYNGYPLSGAETIASFVLGWLVGLISDYIRLLAFGKS